MGIESLLKYLQNEAHEHAKLHLYAISTAFAVGGAYLGYRYLLHRKMQKNYKLEGIKDESGLIREIDELQSEVGFDGKTHKDNKGKFFSKNIVEPFRFVLRLPINGYRGFKNLVTNSEPNFVRVYVNQSLNGHAPVRIEFSFDEGLRSKSFTIPNSKLKSLYETAHDLRVRGYPIGVM